MSTVLEPVALIKDYAIIVDPSDNVAVVKNETVCGLGLTLPNGTVFELRDTVQPGHRFATREIPKDEFVLQYGQPIGTSLGISAGQLISHDNMTDEVPIVRFVSEELCTPAPEYVPETERATFMGFRRPDGR